MHYLESLGCFVHVCYNDAIPVKVEGLFDGVVVSPGPGLPEDSGQLMSFLKEHQEKLPILGVCLGMQALAQVNGGELYNQEVVKHGLQESIQVEKGVLFDTDDDAFLVGLYHSWAITEGDYIVKGCSSANVIMAIENVEKRFFGVQFHPESIMTPNGKKVLENFLKIVPVNSVISAG